MIDFDYWSPTYIAFGKGKESRAGELVRRFGGRKALVHYGGGSAVRSGLLARVKASLAEADVAFVELGGVKPNPRSSLVEEGVRLALAEGVDFLLAIGGGSVIDSSKAIAIGAANGGEWRRFYVGKEVKVRPVIPAALPVGVVLTIAAAGSEGSTNSIINLEPGNLKRGAGGDILRPKFAILNPELTMTLPPFQTACGLADMFAHLCERYFSPTRDVTLTDNLCEAVMRTVVEESAKVMASALYDCAHGAGLAVVMPAWMTYVHKTDPARFARFARNVFDVGHGVPDADAARAGIAAFRSWLKSLGLPLTFAELGAKEEDIPLLVKTLNLSGNTLGGFQPLTEDDVAAIYRLCLAPNA